MAVLPSSTGGFQSHLEHQLSHQPTVGGFYGPSLEVEQITVTHTDWTGLSCRDSHNNKGGWEFSLVICPGGGEDGILEDDWRPSPWVEASLTREQM